MAASIEHNISETIHYKKTTIQNNNNNNNRRPIIQQQQKTTTNCSSSSSSSSNNSNNRLLAGNKKIYYCERCKLPVYPSEGGLVPMTNVRYHRECFKCSTCDADLDMNTYHANMNDLSDLNLYCYAHKPQSLWNLLIYDKKQIPKLPNSFLYRTPIPVHHAPPAVHHKSNICSNEWSASEQRNNVDVVDEQTAHDPHYFRVRVESKNKGGEYVVDISQENQLPQRIKARRPLSTNQYKNPTYKHMLKHNSWTQLIVDHNEREQYPQPHQQRQLQPYNYNYNSCPNPYRYPVAVPIEVNRSLAQQQDYANTVIRELGVDRGFGKIKLSFFYSQEDYVFTITVHEAKNLAAGFVKNSVYAKIILLPDNAKRSKRKTRGARDRANPVWEQHLDYEATLPQVNERTLCLHIKEKKFLVERPDYEAIACLNLSLAYIKANRLETNWYFLEPIEYSQYV